MRKISQMVILVVLSAISSTLFAQQCYLTVHATPSNSRIRIMNIDPKYYPGIPLTCGKEYDIMVDKPGYLPDRKWIEVVYQDHEITVDLQKPTHSNYEAVRGGDFEHKEKTLGILDAIFQNRQVGYLNKISTSLFQKGSRWYQTLQSYIGTSHLNLNHSSEIATQEFIINGNENHVLVVDFEHSKKTNLWYIADAYEKQRNRKIPFRKSGFRPNEFERKFSDLVRKIQSGKIWPYYGLAPHGKLNRRFFQGKTLSLSTERSITIKDIIIHDGTQIRDVIFLKLKYYLPGNRESGTYQSGWLLAGGGSMSSFYKPGENLFADIFFRQNLNLNQKNKGLIYFNLRDLSSNQPRTSMSAGNQPRTSMPNSTYKAAPSASSTVHSNSQSDDMQEEDDDSWIGGKR